MRIPSTSLPTPALLLVALAGCVGPPQPAPAPPPVAPAAPAPRPAPLASDWRDWPQTSGTWRYAADPLGARATFGASGAGYAAALVCDRRSRQIVLSLPAAGPGPFTVRTTSTTRVVPADSVAQADALPPVVLAARLSGTDPILDAMAFSRGRFVLSQPGGAPVVLPAWAEIGRVIEDCRG